MRGNRFFNDVGYLKIICLVSLSVYIQSCSNCKEEKLYFPNGRLQREACISSSGEYNGEVKFYYENGFLESVSNWNNGKQDGIAEAYYKDGTLRIRKHWKNGIEEGQFVQYNDDGKIVKEGIYREGRFFGKDYDYFEDGKIASINILNNNEPTSYLIYDHKGNSTKWLVRITKEEFFLDINKDSLLTGEEFKAKFTLNHKISDSVRVFIEDVEEPIFKWPEDGSTKYEYTIVLQKEGKHNFKGYVQLYYLKNLENMADNSVKIPFEIPIQVFRKKVL